MEISRPEPHVLPPELLEGLNPIQRNNLVAHCRALQENASARNDNYRRGSHNRSHNLNRNFNPHVPPPGCPRNPSLYKTSLCDNWIAGEQCRFGERCWYAHGPQEVRHGSSSSNFPPPHRQHNRRHFYRNNNSALTPMECNGSEAVVVDPAFQTRQPSNTAGSHVSHSWITPPEEPRIGRLELDKLFNSPNSIFKFDALFPHTDTSLSKHYPLESVDSGFDRGGSSSVWTNVSATPSRPSWMSPLISHSEFGRSETDDLFEAPTPASKDDLSSPFPFPEKPRHFTLGSIGSERRYSGEAPDIADAASDRKRMRSEVQQFRSLMRDAEKLVKDQPPQDAEMDEFLSVFQPTTIDAPLESTSSESSYNSTVFPKIVFPFNDDPFYTEGELWHSIGLHSAQLK